MVVVTNQNKTSVVKIVEEIVSDATNSEAITQQLRSYTRVFSPKTGDEVRIQKTPEGPIDVNPSRANETIKSRIDREFKKSSQNEYQDPYEQKELQTSQQKTTFVPPFTKEEAEYIEPRQNDSSSKCHDCAHYIEGGGCHLVQGEIEDKSVCKQYYADLAVALSMSDMGKSNPLYFWGEKITQEAKESIKEKVRQVKWF